jgi:hypothetical protein
MQAERVPFRPVMFLMVATSGEVSRGDQLLLFQLHPSFAALAEQAGSPERSARVEFQPCNRERFSPFWDLSARLQKKD